MKIKKLLSVILSVILISNALPQVYSNGAMVDRQYSKMLLEELIENHFGKNSQEGEVIVVCNEEVDSLMSLQEFKDNNKICEIASVEEGKKIFKVSSNEYSTDELINILKKDKGVISVEKNSKIELASNTATINKDYEWYKDAINNKILDEETKNDFEKEVIVAVIDSGIDYTQAELQDNLWVNDSNELPGTYGYDFVNEDDKPEDLYGHGTHIAGIVLSNCNEDNSKENVKIMSLKIFNENNQGEISDAIEAYNYISKAQDAGYNIVAINVSWTVSDNPEVFKQMVDLVGSKGALSVCASGNAASDNDAIETYPSSIDSPYIISVAATNEKNKIASFSNYGANSVDIAAPGANILSNYNVNSFNPSIYEDRSEYCQQFVDFDTTTLFDMMEDMDAAYSSEANVVEQIDENVLVPKEPSGFNALPMDVIFPYYEISQSQYGTSELSISNEQNFIKTSDLEYSLKYSITDGYSEDLYTITIPYDLEPSETPVYLSMMTKGTSESKIEGVEDSSIYVILDGSNDTTVMDALESLYGESTSDINMVGFGIFAPILSDNWTHSSCMIKESVEEVIGRNLYIIVMPLGYGDYNLYIDDLAISASNIDAEEFGKNEFLSGTSMAAPMVTAAVTMTALYFPNENALEWKDIVLNNATPIDELKGKVATGAMLNIEDIKAYKNNNTYINVNGFQISTYAEGLRTVYTVSSMKNVESLGLIYGLESKVTEEDMILDATNPKVFKFEATEAGKLPISQSEEENSQSYAMTMRYGKSSYEFLSQKLLIRAYAILDDGTIVYSDIENVSTYDVADELYKDILMNSATEHNYLFERILSKVDENYTRIEYINT